MRDFARLLSDTANLVHSGILSNMVLSESAGWRMGAPVPASPGRYYPRTITTQAVGRWKLKPTGFSADKWKIRIGLEVSGEDRAAGVVLRSLYELVGYRVGKTIVGIADVGPPAMQGIYRIKEQQHASFFRFSQLAAEYRDCGAGAVEAFGDVANRGCALFLSHSGKICPWLRVPV